MFNNLGSVKDLNFFKEYPQSKIERVNSLSIETNMKEIEEENLTNKNDELESRKNLLTSLIHSQKKKKLFKEDNQEPVPLDLETKEIDDSIKPIAKKPFNIK